MASVYKRDRDKKRRRSSWYLSYDDVNGERKTKKGFTDKRATEDLALELEQEVKRKKFGLVDPNEQRRIAAAETPIEEHTKAFEKSISKNSPKHVKLTMTRLRRLVKDAEFKTLADIDVDSVEAVLGDMLDAEEIGHKTYNHYASAMSQFGIWLVPNRLATNPVAGIKRLNTEVDIRHPRRALTADEFSKLVQSARDSGVSIQCYDGEQRARIYTLSYMTGLRRKEIASLTPASFNLKTNPATLTVEAACSKHRRKDVLPLHPELVKMLQEWLKGIKRTELLFPKLAKRRTWLMVKKDLERIDIPYRNEDGIADFHAAGRHTHITELLRNGASLPEARELARHSDIRMTMKYTHIGLDDQAKALSKLPWQRKEPGSDYAKPSDETPCQRPASGTRRLNGHSVSSHDTEMTSPQRNGIPSKPLKNSAADATRHALSSPGVEAYNIDPAGSIPAASTFCR